MKIIPTDIILRQIAARAEVERVNKIVASGGPSDDEDLMAYAGRYAGAAGCDNFFAPHDLAAACACDEQIRRSNVAREHAAAVRRAGPEIMVVRDALEQVTRAILAEAARASHHDDPAMLLRRIATEIAGAATHIETGDVDSVDRALDILREMGRK